MPSSPRPPSAQPHHKIRIIGGRWRRSVLPVPTVANLRPTPDRVRETLFNWIQQRWAGDFASRRVLDLFAGTGALGLEAASRGASQVDLVESQAKAVGLLRATCERLGAQQVQVHHDDAARFLQRTAARYDLILLDPPFASDWPERLLPLLATHLQDQGLVYLESDRADVPLGTWQVYREGRAGSVYYRLLTLAPAA